MTQGGTLQDLITTALADGWASTTELKWSEGHIERQIVLFGYSFAPARDRQLKIEVLKPLEKADARPESLSAQYGTGQQPLHSDGAHQDEPPEIILLATKEPSAVPTLLWRLPAQLPAGVANDLHEGLFTVRSGSRAFLAHAVDGYGSGRRVRYDPGCMEPADARARRVAAFIQTATSDATHFTWDAPQTVLAISNRHVLHARGDASQEPDRRMERAALRVSAVAK